ncbi:MAG: ABC transporter permease DevC [Leptolyngbyaceae cyanobacterium]
MLKTLFRKTPVAWLQMSRQKARLLVAIAGITFADVLMFFQLGMRDALYDSQVRPYASLQGDLFLVNKRSDNLSSVRSFPRDNLYRTLGVPGVDSVNTLYLGQADWRNPENQATRRIFVYGIDPYQPAFIFPELDQHLDELKLLNRVVFDRAGGLPQLGDVPTLLEQEDTLTAQVNDLEVQVVGLFVLGASFSANGNLLTSDSTFLRLFSERQANDIDVGVIKLAEGASVEALQAEIQAIMPNDLRVVTIEEFTELELAFWTAGSPIGFIFGAGAGIGFLIGAVIVYQIIYTDVANHLPEYATLKAIGYSDRYLMGVLVQESLILACLGFIPGFVLSAQLYALFQSATLLPVAMKVSRATLVLILTIAMCVGGGAVAMQKLRQADPADIF